MIYKIIGSTFFVLLLFAISLSLFGVEEVNLGRPFTEFLMGVSLDMSSYRFEIPDIPQLDLFDSDGGWLDFLNFLFGSLNQIINILNFIVDIFNWIIQLIQFLYTIITHLIQMRDDVIESASTSEELLSESSLLVL